MNGIFVPIVILIININIPNTISIESGIIIYKISDNMRIIDIDTNNNTIIVFIDNPNTKYVNTNNNPVNSSIIK